MAEGETAHRASEGIAKQSPLAAFRFTSTVAVRFCKIDGNRHTNEVSYFVYMEHVRMLYFEHLGLFDELLDVSGEASLMAVNFACQFHAPSHFLQRLRMAARVVRLGRSSVDFEYTIVTEEDALVATGRQTLVYVDHARNRSRPLPDGARRRITEFENLTGQAA